MPRTIRKSGGRNERIEYCQWPQLDVRASDRKLRSFSDRRCGRVGRESTRAAFRAGGRGGKNGYRGENDEPYAEMSLTFSKSGDLELRADGAPVLAG